MASSRIYVRGLPPSLSEADFRNHFAQRYQLTDVQLKPQRRIGYVGFKTSEDAEKAVRYFHKSFIRMSRLHVEIAQSVRYPTSQRVFQQLTTQAGDAPKPRHSQRKVLTPAADLPLVNNAKNLKRKRAERLGEDAVPERDEGEESHFVPQERANLREKEVVGSPSPQNLQVDTPQDYEESQEIHKVQGFAGRPPADDDDDWMRSRTTRLLGLDDNEPSRNMVQTIRSGETRANEVDSRGLQASAAHGEVDNQPAPGTPTNAEPDPQPISGHEDEGLAVSRSRRLFLRNLAYTVSEDELRTALQPFGSLVEIKVPLDFNSGKSKGFAFATFDDDTQAARAIDSLDGSIFQGRLLHIIPAIDKRQGKLDEFAVSQLPLKKQKLMEKKAESVSSTFHWNSLYMNSDAVIASAAVRLELSKSDLLDPTSSDAAVKQAQIETHAIQEAKRYFESHGVDLEAFGRGDRDGNALLVKNFKFDTKSEDLKKLFAQSADVIRVLMPPGGTIAIVEFPNKVQAKAALSAFAYRKYKDSVLFLERAPRDLFKTAAVAGLAEPREDSDVRSKVGTYANVDNEGADNVELETSTLFVRNLNFSTSSERLEETFRAMDGLLSARVKTKPDPKREGGTLSMGFGFLEFGTNGQARAAFLAMNGYVLDGHELQIKASHKGHDAAAERKREDRAQRQKQRKSRLVVKNLPFEASKKDVRNLFGSYGQVKAVRLPKKMNNTSRGYAFVDFTTPQQAEKAMDLSRTHLLGRRLAIDYAEGDIDDPEKEIEKMQRKVGRQSERVALQELTVVDRKKFITGDGGDEGMDE